MKTFKIFLLVSIGLLLLPGLCFSFDDGDFQVWNTNSVDWKLADNWKANFNEEKYFGDNAKDYYYQHYELNSTYTDLADWLDVGVSYRLVFAESNNSWKEEHRPHLNATLKTSLSDYKMSSRSRLEYRMRQDAEDGCRYRNKVTVKLPKLTKYKIGAYVADEVFYDFITTKLNENRIYGGFDFLIYKELKGEIYYIFKATKSSKEWKETNVLGTKLKIAF